MNAQDCLHLLRKIKDVAFASVDEQGRPQVRIIDVMLVEGEALYFLTARGKSFYRELSSGWVSLTGLSSDWKSVRLSGWAEKLADRKGWIDRFFAENPSMEAVYPGESRRILEPFVIRRGELELFDLGRDPIERESFSLGGAQVKQKGFQITSACRACGACASACPQRCIQAGSPYYIEQRNCLHCGLCAELCPAGAILRRGEKG